VYHDVKDAIKASVTRSIKWRCKKAYSGARKHNLALSDAEVPLERDDENL
jgi:hypothetical protein